MSASRWNLDILLTMPQSLGSIEEGRAAEAKAGGRGAMASEKLQDEDAIYMPASREEWNVLAAKTARVELEPNEDEPVAIIATGPCPRCHHETAFVEPIVAYGYFQQERGNSEAGRLLANAFRRAGAAVRDRNVEIICGCGIAHPETPVDKRGCGASWVLHVAWGV